MPPDSFRCRGLHGPLPGVTLRIKAIGSPVTTADTMDLPRIAAAPLLVEGLFNMFRQTVSSVFLSVVALVCFAVPVNGQGLPAASNMVTEFKGKLKGFQRGVLVIERADGKEALVQLPDDLSSFQFVADAKPAFLKRGTMVRFTGEFSPNGTPSSPIDKVEVFQAINGRVAANMRERFVPGVYPPRGRELQLQPTAKYNIVGGLIGIAPSGMMMVQAGKRQIRVQLAKEAKFEIRFNNLALAQEGDPVSVAGFYQPPDDTKVKADRVTITTERVYGEPVAQTPRRRGRAEKPETDPQGEPDPKDPADPKEAEAEDKKPAQEAAPDGNRPESKEEAQAEKDANLGGKDRETPATDE